MNQEDENKIADALRSQGLTDETRRPILRWDGPMKAVGGDDLDSYLCTGAWAVVATYEEDIPSWDYRMDDRGMRVVGEPTAGQYGGGVSAPEQKHPPFALRRRVFVIGKTRDKMVDELRAHLGEAQKAAQTYFYDVGVSEKRRKDALAETVRVQHELSVERRARELADESAATYQELSKRMEDDLSKVRDAIGSNAWKEIVGAD